MAETATKTLKPIEEVSGMLQRMSEDFSKVLPPQIKVDRFTRIVITALQKTPDLLLQDRQSLYNACLACATDGLIPDGREAALVMFGKAVQYMPMTQGILKKVRNSGEIGMIDAQVVYEKDEYESYIDEQGPHFKHIRANGERGKVMLTYAYARTKDGFVYAEEIEESDMAKIEKMSKTQTVWKGPFADEMRKKSALRRLAKRLPMATDLDVFHRDDNLYDLENPDKPDTVDPQADAATTQPAAKKSRLDSVVDAEVVDPAPINPAKEAKKAPPKVEEKDKIVSGIIVQQTSKDGETNGKAWKKWGFKIGEDWYGTFDTKIVDIAGAAIHNKASVDITFEASEKDGKTFHNIVTLTPTPTPIVEEIPI